MSQFFYGAAGHPTAPVSAHPQHNHHTGRSRRTPRMGATQKQQYRPARTQKEILEAAATSLFMRDFEAAKSFELEDDELFCPFHLLTEDDLQSIHSSGSDRSSLSSGSPESSPLQHQLQPTPTFMLPSPSSSYTSHSSFQHNNTQINSQPKLHQPMAQRTRNPIPIVDPTTRAVASPPPSVSPARQMQQHLGGRRW